MSSYLMVRGGRSGLGYRAPIDDDAPVDDVHPDIKAFYARKAEAEARAAAEPLPINQDRMRAAFNEAGHALASLRWGKSLYSIEVDDRGGGLCRYSPPVLAVDATPYTPEKATAGWMWLCENVKFDPEFIRTEAQVLLAAPAAVELLTGGTIGCGDDLRRAEALVDNLPWSPRERHQLFDDCYAEARSLVNMFQSELKVLAERLYAVGLMHEREIRETLRRHSLMARVVLLGDPDREVGMWRRRPPENEMTAIYDDTGNICIGTVTRNADAHYTARGMGGRLLGLTFATFAEAKRAVYAAKPQLRWRALSA